MILLDIVITIHLGIATFHCKRFLLKKEDRLERKEENGEYDAEDDTFFVEALYRHPMPIFPNDVGRL